MPSSAAANSVRLVLSSPAEALTLDTVKKVIADPSLLAIPLDSAKVEAMLVKYRRLGTPIGQVSPAEAATYTAEYEKFVEAVSKSGKVKIGDAVVENPTEAQLLEAWKTEELRRALEREQKGQEALTRPVKLRSGKSNNVEEFYLPPVVTKTSSAEAEELGKHLQAIGATMYGAYWCSHCYGQKQALGREVVDKYVTYVECDKKGAYNKRDFCKERKVPGFPTWEINGELFPGEKGIAELKAISGFDKKAN